MAVLRYRWLWLTVIVCHVIFFASSGGLTPYVYAQFIKKVSQLSAGSAASDFYPIILFMVGVHVFQTFFGQIALRIMRFTLPHSMQFLEDDAYKHLLDKSSGFFANNFTGSIVTKFNRFVRSFQVIAEIACFELVDLLVNFAFPFVYMCFVAPVIALLYAIFAAVMALSLFYLHRRKIPHAQAVAAQDSMKTGLLADSITNIMSIKTFSTRHLEAADYNRATNRWVELFHYNQVLGNRIRMYKIVIWTANEALVMFFVVRLALSGTLDVGAAAAIMLYVRQLSQTIWNFGKIIEKIEQAVADATELVEILDEPVGVADCTNPAVFTPKHGKISFENVNFTYEDLGSSEVFSGLSLDILPRQKVGLVGPSGGGKTTFVKLLLRFADIQSGTIKIDDTDISQVAQDDLRRAIAYVPQEPILFHRTIADNITYGAGETSARKLAEVTRLSHVDEFINELPQGLQTMVGERGVKLSGGQKQRIAIARAMLKTAPILVLDEATSALDSKSEKLIISALDNLMKGRTTIVIAHRLSTIKKLDRILVLEKGSIKEDGSHSELLKKKGIYANLWEHQMGNFIE